VATEVRVLGPLEVIHDGQAVAIQGAKERALVVSLALKCGRTVSRDRLVEVLWDGNPPASAEASLRVLVSRVRHALARAGAQSVIQTRPSGYVLLAVEVDAHRFEELSLRARSELAKGHPAESFATSRRALGLWRGDQLGVVTTGVLAEATRLEELRQATLETRIEAELACGRHAALIGELEALCRAHPLREGLWALLVTALYRCQR
jgi:DNA-binding SARP family transcriptional activator